VKTEVLRTVAALHASSSLAASYCTHIHPAHRMLKTFLALFVVSVLFPSLTSTLAASRASAATKYHELFVQHFPGGRAAFQEAVKQRADWNPLHAFETVKNESQWGFGHAKFNALGPVVQCPPQLLTSFGDGDGEKRICGVMDSDCTVVSIGSSNQWDFELDVVKKHPNCKIYTLDCTLEVTIPATIGDHVTFHPICMGTADEVVDGKQFLTWGSIAKRLHLERAPTVLKMDIEGFEWTVIPAILREDVHLPHSFSFELHYETYVEALPWKGRQRTDAEIGLFMELLRDLGYLLVDRHDNAQCGCCSELVVAKLLPNVRYLHHSGVPAQATTATHNP
jgi:hypothetical protein